MVPSRLLECDNTRKPERSHISLSSAASWSGVQEPMDFRRWQ